MHSVEIDLTPIGGESLPVNDTRTIYLPVTRELLETLSVGDKVHISFDASITELSESYNGEGLGDMGVKVSKVNVETENEFEELSKDDDEDY